MTVEEMIRELLRTDDNPEVRCYWKQNGDFSVRVLKEQRENVSHGVAKTFRRAVEVAYEGKYGKPPQTEMFG